MTKKDYELIATAIQKARSVFDGSTHGDRLTVDYIADALAADNSRFNRERFLHACEPGANVKARV